MTLFEYRDFWSMDEAESREQFWGVKGDVEKLALGSYFAGDHGVRDRGGPGQERHARSFSTPSTHWTN